MLSSLWGLRVWNENRCRDTEVFWSQRDRGVKQKKAFGVQLYERYMSLESRIAGDAYEFVLPVVVGVKWAARTYKRPERCSSLASVALLKRHHWNLQSHRS